MYEILLVIYLVLALALIGFILIQKGKGAGMGASFGAGASGTVFGSSGSGNFLTKTTTFLAIGFFVVALALGNMTSENGPSAVEQESLFTEEDLAAAKSDTANASAEIPAVDAAKPADQGAEIPTIESKPEEKKEDKSEKKDPPQQ